MQKQNCYRKGVVCLLFLWLVFGGLPAFAQTDIRSLMDQAVAAYPVIAAQKSKSEWAKAEVKMKQNTLLPAVDLAYQLNYATYNNITGMNYAGQLIPISGPPSTQNFNEMVPGSAAGMLVKWAPLSFGQRKEAIKQSQLKYEQQLAGVEDQELKIRFRVAYLYLELASTYELIKVYRKNIERYQTLLDQTNTLIISGIRPGVDSLKFQGELSMAKTELIGLDNLLAHQQIELNALLGSDHADTLIPDSLFAQKLPNKLPDALNTTIHPELKMAQFSLEASKAELSQLNKSWVPRIEFWGTTYARGSGIDFDGTVNKADGWGFSRYNYGLGLQLVFPLIDKMHLKVKAQQQEALVETANKTLELSTIEWKKQHQIALNTLIHSFKIAHEVPIAFNAARGTFEAMQTRYNAGLTDYIPVIQAQYDLLNAEAKLKNAYINSWKSMLQLAMAAGNINLFLNQTGN